MLKKKRRKTREEKSERCQVTKGSVPRRVVRRTPRAKGRRKSEKKYARGRRSEGDSGRGEMNK